MSHLCARPGCDIEVHDHELACRADWMVLPVSLRNRIWNAWRRGNTDAHRRAVLEAVKIWNPPPPPALRCRSCRTVTDITDRGRGLCVVCARAELGSGPAPLEVCRRCRREVDVLIGINRDPAHCFDCTLELVAGV